MTRPRRSYCGSRGARVSTGLPPCEQRSNSTTFFWRGRCLMFRGRHWPPSPRRVGLETVTDPSNADLRFDRVRLRALPRHSPIMALIALRLAETAARLGRAAEALDHYTSEFLRSHFQADRFGVVRGEADAFAAVPEEVGLRALALIVKAVGGSRIHAAARQRRSALLGGPRVRDRCRLQTDARRRAFHGGRGRAGS